MPSTDTFLTWAAYEADHAEADGTIVIVAASQVAEELGVSRSTICRCRAAARRLGVYRTLLGGRQGSLGDRADQGWRTGVWPRRLANESSFCLPRWLAVGLHRQRRSRSRRRGRSPAQTPVLVDDDTPPYGTHAQNRKLSGHHGVLAHHIRSAIGAAPPPAPTNQTGPAPSGLARAVTAREGPVPWLWGASAARITPALRRFVAEGWTPRDLARALAVVDSRRWDRPADQVRYPAALLAWFLRRIDAAADRPSLLDQIEAEQRREARRREQLTYAASKAAASEPIPAWHQARRRLGV